MRRCAAARRHLLFCQNMGGAMPPPPLLTPLPLNQSYDLLVYVSYKTMLRVVHFHRSESALWDL